MQRNRPEALSLRSLVDAIDRVVGEAIQHALCGARAWKAA